MTQGKSARSTPTGPPARQLSWVTATQLVVASMVGTGVFTTTGYFLADIPSAPAALLGWVIGGVLALCGALAYGELSAALPDNGGEVALLSRIYHPALGFIAGVVGVVVGFAAPIAAAAIAFGEYASRAWPAIPEQAAPLLGAGVVIASSGVHWVGVRGGARAQDVLTALKIALIVVVAIAGIALGDVDRLFVADVELGDALSNPKFAIGLIYVAFAYTGWNAAGYIAGEARTPETTLPRAFSLGTLVVLALYVLLNAAFLMAAPMEALEGQTEIASVAATSAAGTTAGRVLSAVVAIGLLSTTGAMTMTGARMAEALAKGRPRLRWLERSAPDAAPRVAIGVQAVFALAMTLTATFETLLVYVGVTLTLSAMLTVIGVFILRAREPGLKRPYRTLGYPATPILFVALSLWMIVASILERPSVALAAGGTVAFALALYAWVGRVRE